MKPDKENDSLKFNEYYQNNIFFQKNKTMRTGTLAHKATTPHLEMKFMLYLDQIEKCPNLSDLMKNTL